MNYFLLVYKNVSDFIKFHSLKVESIEMTGVSNGFFINKIVQANSPSRKK